MTFANSSDMARKFCLGLLLLWCFCFLFILFSDASAMSVWWMRKLSVNGICICLVGHLFLTGLFLFLKEWKRGLCALFLFPVLLFATFIAMFFVGPGIEAIEAKVSNAVSIPRGSLKCIGGRLSRESVAVFEIPRSTLSVSSLAFPTGDVEILSRLNDVAKTLGVPLRGGFRAWRVQLEFDTVFVVESEDENWFVFYFGMSDM